MQFTADDITVTIEAPEGFEVERAGKGSVVLHLRSLLMGVELRIVMTRAQAERAAAAIAATSKATG